MLYKDEAGVENEVFMIHSVEERDHHTISLSIDRPSTNNKHVIGREAYQFHKPHVKDYLVIDADGKVSIVASADLGTLGTPIVTPEPTLDAVEEPKVEPTVNPDGLQSTPPSDAKIALKIEG